MAEDLLRQEVDEMGFRPCFDSIVGCLCTIDVNASQLSNSLVQAKCVVSDF